MSNDGTIIGVGLGYTVYRLGDGSYRIVAGGEGATISPEGMHCLHKMASAICKPRCAEFQKANDAHWERLCLCGKSFWELPPVARFVREPDYHPQPVYCFVHRKRIEFDEKGQPK